MNATFTIISEVLSGGKKQLTDRQMQSAEIRRTAKFGECEKCKETWSLDEADECEWCEG